MKAFTASFSLVALLAALVVLPGCGGDDDAVPPAAGTTGGAVSDPMLDDGMGMPGDDMGTMEGPAGDLDTLDDPIATPDAP